VSFSQPAAQQNLRRGMGLREGKARAGKSRHRSQKDDRAFFA
jgi:hypothetical protein